MSALSKASDCLDHFKDSALTGIVNVGVCLCIICLRRRGERTQLWACCWPVRQRSHTSRLFVSTDKSKHGGKKAAGITN